MQMSRSVLVAGTRAIYKERVKYFGSHFGPGGLICRMRGNSMSHHARAEPKPSQVAQLFGFRQFAAAYLASVQDCHERLS